MTLVDIDKNNMDRSAPNPNRSDRLNDGSIKAHGTNSMNITTDASANVAGLGVGAMRMVYSNTANVVSDGTMGNTTTTTQAHPLGYKPIIIASMNNSTLAGLGLGLPGPVDLFLPTWVSIIVPAAGSNNPVEFTVWTQPLVDASNVYFLTFNTTGVLKTFTITYYLFQQGSQVSQ